MGYIVPSSGTTTQAEWDSVRPDGVLFVCSRVRVENVAFDSLRSAASELSRAASELATADINCLIQVGTPFALIPGLGGSDAIEKLLHKESGVPSMSMARAAVLALKQLGARRVVLAAPYTPEIRTRLEAMLVSAGLEIVGSECLGLVSNLEINRLPAFVSYQTARKALAKAAAADAIFISSGGWRTFEVIEHLETDTGLPVVSSNAAGLWAGLGLAGVRQPIHHHGRLLREMEHEALVPFVQEQCKSTATVQTV